MQYQSFRIQNFKGIKDTTVSLQTIGGASVFAFVGLNESGKTTVLEAIHTFSPDAATSELLGGDDESGIPFTARVPRHLLSEFTGDVTVTANLTATEDDIKTIADGLRDEHAIGIDVSSIPKTIIFERVQRFSGGDFVNNYFTLVTLPQIKTGAQKKWRVPTLEETVKIRAAFYRLTPDIAYFPTFVFNFPQKFFLTNRGGTVDRFYRRVFQDILDADGKGQTIERDIIRRVRADDLVLPWTSFLSAWLGNNDKAKIQQVMDRASAAVTRLVFGRWNKIFGEDARGKEVVISYNIVEGEVRDKSGTATNTNKHDVEVSFQIKDGTRRFNVNDRSLGFRWFFAFMLFTQFRVARSSTRPLLFLFDEPASNLHAAAQQRLIDCFPEVATGEHMLAYTTHSHYMIEPKWLEQTFIVTNRADAPLDSMMDDISLDDESLDVKVATYRSFVHDHPTQTNYFQPVLDRLEVVPSRFDIQRQSVVLEGRSDYYVLRYAATLLGRTTAPLMPGLGAGTLGALVALHIGWGLNLLFVMDGDKQGVTEKKRYVEEFGLPEKSIVTLSDMDSSITVIEDILDDEAKGKIAASLGLEKTPSKPQIKRFFQESLASGKNIDLGKGFTAKAGALLVALEARVAASESVQPDG